MWAFYAANISLRGAARPSRYDENKQSFNLSARRSNEN